MKRTTKIAVAALAATALLAPSQALAGRGSHLLSVYKFEKHLDFDGELGT